MGLFSWFRDEDDDTGEKGYSRTWGGDGGTYEEFEGDHGTHRTTWTDSKGNTYEQDEEGGGWFKLW